MYCVSKGLWWARLGLADSAPLLAVALLVCTATWRWAHLPGGGRKRWWLKLLLLVWAWPWPWPGAAGMGMGTVR